MVNYRGLRILKEVFGKVLEKISPKSAEWTLWKMFILIKPSHRNYRVLMEKEGEQKLNELWPSLYQEHGMVHSPSQGRGWTWRKQKMKEAGGQDPVQFSMNYSPAKYWVIVIAFWGENQCKYSCWENLHKIYRWLSSAGDNIRSVGKTCSLAEIGREEECSNV